MARYIDTSKVTIPKGFFEDLDVPKLLDWLNSQPTADVVPKKEIANVLHDLKIAVHNKAHYNHAKEVPTYITIRELDAILQGFVDKYRAR